MADIGIGATLRETRMRARIDIGEVELRTKIRAKYLRAIENEEWDLLPGPIYVKSFLRTYAEYLGLDSRLIVDEFRRRYERPTEHDLRPLSSLKREREKVARGPRGPVLPPWIWIGAVLIVVLVGLFLLGKLNNPKNNAISGGGHHTTTVHHHGKGRAHHTASTTTRSTPTKTTPTGVTLAMVPTGPVWVCVESRNGNKLINGVQYTVGQKIPTESRQQLFVNLGNANVKITVNGTAYPLAASASSIGLKITAQGVSQLSNRPSCA